jgi:hypothetical protein
LRWSGCTANAPEFAELAGDDVAGRHGMLAETSRLPNRAPWANLLAEIRCEVSGDIARTLGMPPAVQHARGGHAEGVDDGPVLRRGARLRRWACGCSRRHRRRQGFAFLP